MAREEVLTLTKALNELEDRGRILLLPRDPLDDRNVLLEVCPAARPHSATGSTSTPLWLMLPCVWLQEAPCSAEPAPHACAPHPHCCSEECRLGRYGLERGGTRRPCGLQTWCACSRATRPSRGGRCRRCPPTRATAGASRRPSSRWALLVRERHMPGPECVRCTADALSLPGGTTWAYGTRGLENVRAGWLLACSCCCCSFQAKALGSTCAPDITCHGHHVGTGLRSGTLHCWSAATGYTAETCWIRAGPVLYVVKHRDRLCEEAMGLGPCHHPHRASAP